MTSFNITIKAQITKNYLVIADTREEADRIAHEAFTTDCDASNESYEQDTIHLEDIK